MTQAQLIETVLNTPPERYGAIIAAAKGADRPRPGNRREAAAILQVCPRTIARYVRAGLLKEITITPRKVRYDLRQVERLAERGAAALEVAT